MERGRQQTLDEESIGVRVRDSIRSNASSATEHEEEVNHASNTVLAKLELIFHMRRD